MKAALAPDVVAQRLRDLPEAISSIEMLVLFGSIARGRARRGSDVDLGVQCDGPADLAALTPTIASRLGAAEVDLIDLRRASPLLAFQIARTGRLLFERRPGLFRQLQSLTVRRYVDTRKLRDARRRAINLFLERWGLA